mmetsp:Transcript_36071/g.58282  ORF Transcript_36071/g.58282 Transcript_36071/m.58282 type:complete len:207 (-) Transcript_36071:66-686(-)
MSRTTSRSAEVWNVYPAFRKRSIRLSVTSRPATSIRVMECGIANPSYIGTACVTPSPESKTTPVVRPDAYKLRTACKEINRAGTLRVSKKISAAFSLFLRGFKGASVRSTGCFSLSTFNSFSYTWLHTFSISAQFFTIPCSIGYCNFKMPRSSSALLPTKLSPSAPPAITLTCLGLPTYDGKTHFGKSSPANPAFKTPEPLSITTG